MSAPSIATTWSVTAQADGSVWQTAELKPGMNLFVGSSRNCGLQLEDPDVSALQCLIMLEEETVWIQDWASKTGTLVNGEAIETRTAVRAADSISVGRFQLRVGPASSGSKPSAREEATTDQVGESAAPATQPRPPVGSDPVSDSASPLPPEPIGTGDDPSASASPDSVPLPSPEYQPRVTADPSRVATTPAPPDQSETKPSRSDTQSPPPVASSRNDDTLGGAERGLEDRLFDAESFDEETVTLLRAEIEDLQAALAQRDEQIESLAAESDSAQLATGDPLDDGQTDALLARLQDLLNEAECHDERVACLEDLLQAAEEANQAEQEERAQLEAWVGDIERRIGEREAEWNAEMEALRQQVQQAFDERDRVQHQLKHVATEGSAPAAYEETLERLQQQNKSLQDELEAARKENVNLTQRIERSENQQEEVLREERATIAQERAEVSRLRFELQRKMTEAESLPQPKDHHPDREFSDRLRTLREHLREIHEEEKHERERQRNDSALSSRIGRLWKRLES